MIIADDTQASVSLGRTIDWRVFHHFCLTYDGPSRGGESTLAFYFDGDHRWQETLSLDTKIEEGRWMSLGMSQMYSDSLSAALDEVYIYASALDASAIEVLYGSVSAAPTVTPVPTSHCLRARWWRTIRSSTGRRKTLITPGTARPRA